MLAGMTTLLLWSGTTVANKIAVQHMDPLSAGVLRSLLAGVLALVVAGLLRLPFPPSMRERAWLALAGLASFAAWPALLSLGVARTTAGHAALMMATTPIFTVLIGAGLERRWPARDWWLGAAAAVGATAWLIGGRTALPSLFDPGASHTGNLIVLAGSAICALGYVAGARVTPRIGAVATTFWGLVIALLALIPAFALIADRTDWTALPTSSWLAIAWMTLLSSLAGYGLWFFALGHGGIGRIGSLQLAMPVLTLIAAITILGERASTVLALSCAVVMAGTWYAHRAHAEPA